MKKTIAIILAIVSLLACFSLSGCDESHEDWHNKQIERGMSEARKQLGR